MSVKSLYNPVEGYWAVVKSVYSNSTTHMADDYDDVLLRLVRRVASKPAVLEDYPTTIYKMIGYPTTMNPRHVIERVSEDMHKAGVTRTAEPFDGVHVQTVMRISLDPDTQEVVIIHV